MMCGVQTLNVIAEIMSLFVFSGMDLRAVYVNIVTMLGVMHIRGSADDNGTNNGMP